MGNTPTRYFDPFGLFEEEGDYICWNPLECAIGEADTLVELSTGAGIGAAYVKKKLKACIKDNVTKRPSRFRKKTVTDAWDDAADGTKPGKKKCSTCDDDVSGNPHNNEPRNTPDGWDGDHQPKWKDRDLNGKTRKEVLDEYNRGVRLRCRSCNRADN